VLEEILDTGAHGVLIVRDRDAGVEVSLPFVEGMVEVQAESRCLVVDPPEGLIEATREPIGGRS
jgi:ribosomal 30S subunit maturation factor RimM